MKKNADLNINNEKFAMKVNITVWINSTIDD